MAEAGAGKGRTLVEKIAARASGRVGARAGDLVTAEVDLCLPSWGGACGTRPGL